MDGFEPKTLRDAEPVFVHEHKAKFQEVDAAGFVFFARMFDWFHDAWLAFIEAGGLRHADVVHAHQWGAPLRHVEADFFAPIRFGDTLQVGLVKAAWERSNLFVGYRITNAGRVAAVGLTHHVVVELPAMKRIEPPAEFREVFRNLRRG